MHILQFVIVQIPLICTFFFSIFSFKKTSIEKNNTIFVARTSSLLSHGWGNQHREGDAQLCIIPVSCVRMISARRKGDGLKVLLYYTRSFCGMNFNLFREDLVSSIAFLYCPDPVYTVQLFICLTRNGINLCNSEQENYLSINTGYLGINTFI